MTKHQNGTDDDVDTLDLDALVKPVGKIKLRGKTYVVLPVQGAAMTLIEQLVQEAKGSKGKPKDGTEYLERGRKIVAAVVPTLGEALIKELNPEQLTAIIGKATGQVDKVKKVVAASAGKDRGSPKTTAKTTSR